MIDDVVTRDTQHRFHPDRSELLSGAKGSLATDRQDLRSFDSVAGSLTRDDSLESIAFAHREYAQMPRGNKLVIRGNDGARA